MMPDFDPTQLTDEQRSALRRSVCCIGCGLPLIGFLPRAFVDQYSDVYHSRACYDRCEQEMQDD